MKDWQVCNRVGRGKEIAIGRIERERDLSVEFPRIKRPKVEFLVGKIGKANDRVGGERDQH